MTHLWRERRAHHLALDDALKHEISWEKSVEVCSAKTGIPAGLLKHLLAFVYMICLAIRALELLWLQSWVQVPASFCLVTWLLAVVAER